MRHAPNPLLANRLLMYRDRVPKGVRFWLIVLFALFYQLTGGVYLAALSQMVGELAFLSEDVTMAGYCSLIGLNMIFPVLFRWKFYLYTRQIFFVSATGVLLCAATAMVATVPWVLWIVCLFAGYFKMMGMFACMSTIQLNITPTRNYGAFFPVVYVLVCGAIQLSGILTAHIAYDFNWKLVYLVIVGLMLVIDGIAYFMMKPDHRSGPFIPLKGVDWLGHLLWLATCCVAAWIFTFGEHYDWWDSYPVWRATWIFVVLLAVTLCESCIKKEPFISLKAFCYPTTWSILLILFGMAVLQASAHVLQPVFMNSVAGYDYFTVVHFNYPELYGIIMGAILAFFALVHLKWRMKTFFFVCFLLVTFYLVASYFLIDSSSEAWQFYLPLFAFGAAEVMMETGATFILAHAIPFPHFFMNISIVGFARCGVGTAAAGAIVERLFAWSMNKHVMLSSSEPDFVNYAGEAWMTRYFTEQHLMLAVKECFGYLALFGLFMLLVVLLSKYSDNMMRFVPRIVSVARWIRNPRHTADPTLT
jgi:hypothetical protein